MPRRVSLRPPISGKRASKARLSVLRYIYRQVRCCNYSDRLVIETDHLRHGESPPPGVGVSGAREFFQVAVQVEDDALTIRTERFVSGRWEIEIREACPPTFAFPIRAGRAVERAARRLAAIVRRPDAFLPKPGHRFPPTGRPVDTAMRRSALGQVVPTVLTSAVIGPPSSAGRDLRG